MEYKYRLELRWSPEDGAWLVDVPELPGAMADGATPEEAVAHAHEVIDNWIAFAREHGREVPEPEALAARALRTPYCTPRPLSRRGRSAHALRRPAKTPALVSRGHIGAHGKRGGAQ